MIDSKPIKQKRNNQKIVFAIKAVLVVVSVSALVGGVFMRPVVNADTYDAKISQLRADNNSKQTVKASLLNEAESLEATIAGLQAQINSLQAQINDNEAKRQGILQQIAVIEVEINKHRGLLGENIRAMYLEGDISTFEMLASSRDLSDFVDKEQYRNTVKSKIQASIDKINELKSELDSQKATLDKLLADQRTIQSTLDAQRAEQARLLSLNQTERSSLDAEIRANSAQIAKLRSQQAAENAKLFGNGVRYVSDASGYPWAGVRFPNTIVDPWGMYMRQCVSYTAWKVASSGRHMPYWGGHGNAKQWDDNARAAGIPVDGSPRVGDVAVSNAGRYGHVMYVEAVYGDGTIYVSQYNASWSGSYSEARLGTGGLVFIHF